MAERQNFDWQHVLLKAALDIRGNNAQTNQELKALTYIEEEGPPKIELPGATCRLAAPIGRIVE